MLMVARSSSINLAINLVPHAVKCSCSVMVFFTSRISDYLSEVSWSFYLSHRLNLITIGHHLPFLTSPNCNWKEKKASKL